MTRGSRRRPPAAELLAAEHGTLYKEAETRVALVYPSPYHVAMSSLGYQQIYRSLHELPQMAADRAMFDDSEAGPLRCGSIRVRLMSTPPLRVLRQALVVVG